MAGVCEGSVYSFQDGRAIARRPFLCVCISAIYYLVAVSLLAFHQIEIRILFGLKCLL